MSEQDSNFFRTFVMVLVALLVFMFIIIYLANVITNDNKHMDDPRAQAHVDKLIQPVGEVNTEASAAAPAASAAAPASGGAVDGKSIFQSTCFACHGTGAAGAPKAGDKAAWAPHIAKGKATLYKHAIHGFTGKKGVMPPKGGNASLSDDAVKAAVDYMVGLVK